MKLFKTLWQFFKLLLLIVLIVGVVMAFVIGLVWVSQNTSPAVDLAKVSNLTQPLQHIATVLALVAAGYWFYLRRRAAVKPDVSQDIVVVKFEEQTPKFIYVRVVITVANKGEVPFDLGRGFAAISQIKPLPVGIGNRLPTGSFFDTKTRTSVDWPFYLQPDGADGKEVVDSRKLNVVEGLKTVEPGLTEQIYADFLLPPDSKIIEVYSYVENKNRELGWMRKTIHDVEKEAMS